MHSWLLILALWGVGVTANTSAGKDGQSYQALASPEGAPCNCPLRLLLIVTSCCPGVKTYMDTITDVATWTSTRYDCPVLTCDLMSRTEYGVRKKSINYPLHMHTRSSTATAAPSVYLCMLWLLEQRAAILNGECVYVPSYTNRR
ncbi:hypothetical protein CI102_6764 [Trichoderma harzianum]|nr:hypothetical protein CI102_6764 [Trichoderma harzianum]